MCFTAHLNKVWTILASARMIFVWHTEYTERHRFTQIKFRLRYVCIENKNLCSSVNFCVICVLYNRLNPLRFCPTR